MESENSNKSYFDYLDTVPLDRLHRIDCNHLLCDYLVNCYISGKYSHTDIAYLFFSDFDNNSVYLYKAVKQIISIMIDRKVNGYSLNAFVLRWNGLSNCNKAFDIDMIEILTNTTNYNWLRDFLLELSDYVYYLFTDLYDKDRERLKELMLCMRSENNNNILLAYISNLHGRENRIETKIMYMIVEFMNINLSNITCENEYFRKHIDKLKEEGV